MYPRVNIINKVRIYLSLLLNRYEYIAKSMILYINITKIYKQYVEIQIHLLVCKYYKS